MITLRELREDMARSKLSRFVRDGWSVLEPSTRLEWNWHIDVVCDHVQSWLTEPGAPQNLLINVPPGTMKSLIFSVFTPAWMWLRRPAWRAIYASGNPSVVTRDSLKTRQLITSAWYQDTFSPQRGTRDVPGWKLSADQNEKQKFANTCGGFRQGVGAGGSVTGDRADLIAADDPNDAKEIHSKAHRTAINEQWWDMAFHNRVAHPTESKRGVIMQRLHEQDLAGYLLEHERGEWAHLCIPMEAEIVGQTEDGKPPPGDRPTWRGWSDPRTETGALLMPERWGPAFVRSERTTLGSSGYAGQMQQRPAPASGNKFKREWWRFYSPGGGPAGLRPKGCSAEASVPEPLSFEEEIQSWDCAFKDGDTNDFVVGLVLARIGSKVYVRANDRARRDFSKTVVAVVAMRERFPRTYEICIEDKANGSAVINTLEGRVPGVLPIEPMGGKESRAAAIEPMVEAGQVFLPEGAEWLEDWIDEFASFPKGKHDDQVDALAQGLIKMLFTDSDVAHARLLLNVK